MYASQPVHWQGGATVHRLNLLEAYLHSSALSHTTSYALSALSRHACTFSSNAATQQPSPDNTVNLQNYTQLLVTTQLIFRHTHTHTATRAAHSGTMLGPHWPTSPHKRSSALLHLMPTVSTHATKHLLQGLRPLDSIPQPISLSLH